MSGTQSAWNSAASTPAFESCGPVSMPVARSTRIADRVETSSEAIDTLPTIVRPCCPSSNQNLRQQQAQCCHLVALAVDLWVRRR
jgi:hypothetical protein